MKPPVPATGIGIISARCRGGMEKVGAFFVSAAGDGDRASAPSLGNNLARSGGGKDRGEAIVVSSDGDGDRATTTGIGNNRARLSRGIKREEAIFVSAAADDFALANGNRASNASTLDGVLSVVIPKGGNLGPVAPAGGVSIAKSITQGDRVVAPTVGGAKVSSKTSPDPYTTHRDKDLARVGGLSTAKFNVCFDERNFRRWIICVHNISYSMRAGIYRSVGLETESKAKLRILNASYSAEDEDDYSKVVRICGKEFGKPKKTYLAMSLAYHLYLKSTFLRF